MKSIITKAVLPVAGFGTRFLPATKANPKEMLPIIDKPLIQYAVEEAVDAGITELIFITNSNKRSIEDHFDTNHELEAKLARNGQFELLKVVHDILPKGVTAAYIRQQSPLGLGDAILCAKSFINNEPFAVILADDLINNGAKGCLYDMVQCYQELHASIIAVEMIPHKDTKKYGIVSLANPSEKYHQISAIVEKPQPEDAPTDLAVVGRYILKPSIFEALMAISRDSHDEVQLTDAISLVLSKEPIFAYYVTGKRYDCGSKLGYLKAMFEYSLIHPEVGEGFSAYLKEQMKYF